MRTLVVDIGGTGIKMLLVGDDGSPLGEHRRELTPHPASPEPVVGVIEGMLAEQEPFDRVSVGFPGVVTGGVVRTAPSLGTEAWRGFDLARSIAALTGKPVRVINDADLQGYGVIEGRGVEMVLTFGTGLGTALYLDGRLLPNLELAHHPLGRGTYEELVADATLRRIGKARWRRNVGRILETIDRIFNPDLIHVGGGNARWLVDPLPERVRRFDLVEGMTGGVRLWDDARWHSLHGGEP